MSAGQRRLGGRANANHRLTGRRVMRNVGGACAAKGGGGGEKMEPLACRGHEASALSLREHIIQIKSRKELRFPLSLE